MNETGHPREDEVMTRSNSMKALCAVALTVPLVVEARAAANWDEAH